MSNWINRTDLIELIQRIPSEVKPDADDYARVIRCKDCKYSRGEPIADGRYWCIESCGYFQFCSEAERKEE